MADHRDDPETTDRVGGAEVGGQVGDAGEGVVCPMPCERCDVLGPGGCEDCLDCLLWPEVPPERSTGCPPLPGRTSPTKTAELRAARAALEIGTRVGLVIRRHRREAHVSQRDLAAAVGWSQTALGRAEVDASALPVARVEALLRHLGHRLAVVPLAPADATDPTDSPAALLHEDPDEAWGATDLIARDGAGRRPPPYSEVIWHSILDRRMSAGVLGHEAEWTWQRQT